MNTRLLQFLTAENISQSQFADTIGVARASVSHILAGRNKPGFDFIESTSRHYPTLNLDWLIMGTGKMYKSPSSSTVQSPSTLPQTGTLLFDDQTETLEKPTSTDSSQSVLESPAAPSPKVNATGIKQQLVDNKRNIKKIIVFYDDNSFQEII